MLLSLPCHLLITPSSLSPLRPSYIILCESTSSEADAQMFRQAEGQGDRMSGRRVGREGREREATANNIYPPTEPNRQRPPYLKEVYKYSDFLPPSSTLVTVTITQPPFLLPAFLATPLPSNADVIEVSPPKTTVIAVAFVEEKRGGEEGEQDTTDGVLTPWPRLL